MLHISFLQNWYEISDPGAEKAPLDVGPMWTFAGIEFGMDRIPNEPALLKFRCLPTNRDLTEKFIEALSHRLENKGFTLGVRTVVDATINHIMPTTKNESKALPFPASNTAYAARFCWWR